MPTLYIANGFSLSMLEPIIQMSRNPRIPRFVRDPYDFVRSWAESDDPNDEVLSVVDDADTAALFSELLGIPVALGRPDITLRPGDVLLVGQYTGPRLSEGATELPEDATMEWWSI